MFDEVVAVNALQVPALVTLCADCRCLWFLAPAGQLIPLMDEQLMDRRTMLAEQEIVSNDGRGKPMSDWEADAIADISAELLSYSEPPIALDGAAYARPEPPVEPELEAAVPNEPRPMALLH